MSHTALPPQHPINRSARIADLVLKDVRAAISCHACFVAANDEVGAAKEAAWPKGMLNADVLNVATNALVNTLALRLARLFDPGKPGAPLKGTDLASIPILMRLLAEEGVEQHLVDEARGWTPEMTGMDAIHAAGVERALREATTTWSTFQASPEGAHAVDALKRFRNHALVHTLDKTFDEAVPRVEDLFRLFDCMLALAGRLSLAFRGEHWEPDELHRRGTARGRDFWRRALEANRAV